MCGLCSAKSLALVHTLREGDFVRTLDAPELFLGGTVSTHIDCAVIAMDGTVVLHSIADDGSRGVLLSITVNGWSFFLLFSKFVTEYFTNLI